MDQRRSLTRREFDEVIRRATELAAHEGESGDLSEDELFRIARDVGLPERHVRAALTELRAGGIVVGGTRILDRVFGPETVRGVRVVPGSPSELAHAIDEFLVAGHLLQSVRRSDRLLQYRPAVDWISQVARAASSTSKRYYVASARSVEVHLEPVADEGGTVVEFEVDPGTRGDSVGGSLLASLLGGGGAGVGVGFLVASTLPAGLAVALGAVVAGACAAAITWAVGRHHQKKLAEVRSEVEGVLDRLEAGEGLEPPPPSWRRWVKRHFHGARRLLGEDEDDHRGEGLGFGS